MEIDRRQFAVGLAAMVAGAGSTRAGAAGAATATVEAAIIAATVCQADGSFAAVLYDVEKGLIEKAGLPARGHDVAINPVTREAIAFARRPGTFAVAYGRGGGRAPVAFSAPAGRHFYGHGVFSPDGRLLYTTENEIGGGAGRIGVWDVPGGYRRIGEFASHGLGPHDVNLLSDGLTLVVANGGLITHPDHGRRPLNLATMQPSLVYVDRLTGDLVERHDLPASMAKRSLRHLDVGARDTVVFGCQFKGAKTEWADLIGFHRRGEPVSFLSGAPEVNRALRHYVSSVAVDRGGTVAGVTSSRGGEVVLVDLEKRGLIGVRRFADVSGVAAGPAAGELIVTSGGGDVAELASGAGLVAPGHAPWAWDNHAVAL
jgi:hypothetical protein